MNCKDCYVEGCTHRPFPNETECVFRQWTAKQFDLQSFRAEAAKDILCAVLPSIQIIDGDFSKSLSNAISNSIDTADKLVKQLKEKEEK